MPARDGTARHPFLPLHCGAATAPPARRLPRLPVQPQYRTNWRSWPCGNAGGSGCGYSPPRRGRLRAAGLVEDVSAQPRPTPKRTSTNVPNSGCIMRHLRASSGRRPMRRVIAVRHDAPRIRTPAHASLKPCGRSPADMRGRTADRSMSSAVPHTGPADLRDGTEGLRTAPHSGQRTLRPPRQAPSRTAMWPFDDRGERNLRGAGCPRRRFASPP